MTTKITPSVLENTSVVAATHGTAAAVPVIVVDPQGRITGVTNTSISIGTSQIGSGTLDDARLPAQGTLTAANYYGDAAKTVAIVTDAKGRIKSAANVTIAIASSAVTGLATSATTDTTNASNISSGTLATARLADSGVVARTYGTASSVSQVVVDSKGRITGISNVAIQIANTQITSWPTFVASATTDTTNATNIGSGTLNAARLPTSGVSAGSYGSASAVSAIAVDSTGRITSATSTAILIGAGAVTGLAGVATSGRYDALLANSGQPTNLNQFINGPGYITSASVPTNTSQLINGAGFITSASVPTNTSQLNNNSGFITSAATAVAGIGDILGLYNKNGVGGDTGTTFYPINTEVAGSNLFYVTGAGRTANPHYRDGGFYHGGAIVTEEVVFYATGGTAPWNLGYANVVTLSGTWRALRPNKYAQLYTRNSDEFNNFYFVCHIGLWQRIA